MLCCCLALACIVVTAGSRTPSVPTSTTAYEVSKPDDKTAPRRTQAPDTHAQAEQAKQVAEVEACLDEIRANKAYRPLFDSVDPTLLDVRSQFTWAHKAVHDAAVRLQQNEPIDHTFADRFHNHLREYRMNVEEMPAGFAFGATTVPDGNTMKKLLADLESAVARANKIAGFQEVSVLGVRPDATAQAAVIFGKRSLLEIRWLLDNRTLTHITTQGTNASVDLRKALDAASGALDRLIDGKGERVVQINDAGKPLADQTAPLKAALEEAAKQAGFYLDYRPTAWTVAHRHRAEQIETRLAKDGFRKELLAVKSLHTVPSTVSDTEAAKKSPASKISSKARDVPKVPAWAEQIAPKPDKKLVPDERLRGFIEKSGWAWHVRDKATGIEMLLVPQGSYRRGASDGDTDALANEKPAHAVMISQAFYLGRYEVQEREYTHVLEGEPRAKELGLPRTALGFDEVQEFLRKANEGQSGSVLRLPTEAEWEHACRAWTEEPRYASPLAEIGWYDGNSGKQPHRVGDLKPNPLGFSDMIGNASEWCSDVYVEKVYDELQGSEPESRSDPTVADNGKVPAWNHVIRGGAYHRPARENRASFRQQGFPKSDSFKGGPYGFRVARNP